MASWTLVDNIAMSTGSILDMDYICMSDMLIQIVLDNEMWYKKNPWIYVDQKKKIQFMNRD